MNIKRRIFRGYFRVSPIFLRELRELEGRYSNSKQRFDPSLVAGCVRCRFGHVKVLVCRPFSVRLRPFPTTFWLVCPYLTRQAGMIEAEGGVRELEGYLRANGLAHEWRGYNLRHQVLRLGLAGESSRRYLYRFMRRVYCSVMRGGVGGIRYGDDVNVKCLHLQAASFIGLGYHPGWAWLKAKGLCDECEDRLCDGMLH